MKVRNLGGFRFLSTVILVFGLAAVLLGFNTGIIQLSSFPSEAVADGHTPINIDADVRDTNGRPVPDGTPVVFTTDLGSFKSPIVTTQNGIAHAKLIAPSQTGVANINASSVAYSASASFTYTFVSSRSELSKSNEYIEVDCPKPVSYSFEQGFITATAPKKGAFLRYRDVEIHADSLQANINSLELRAKNATLKIGKAQRTFGDLYYRLDKLTGYGTTTYERAREGVTAEGDLFKFVETSEKISTYGAAAITGVDAAATGPFDTGLFRFDDLAKTATVITAKKVTAFPSKKVLFEAATIYVGNAKVMKLPLYELNLVGQPALFSDTILNINNSQLSLDYPYYLILKPGVTSDLRLTTGTANSTGIYTNRGVFLDYEYKWDRGDDMQGGVSFEGLGRNDWGIMANQSWKFSNGGSVSTMLEMPEHQSLYGSLAAFEPLKGFELSASASAGHSLTGTPLNSQDFNLSLEHTPFHIGNLPLSFYVGFEAYTNTSETVGWFSDPTNELAPILQQSITDSQTAYGPELRAQSTALNLGGGHLNMSFQMAKLAGHNTLTGLTYDGTLTYDHSFGHDLTSVLSYGYTEDGFNSDLLGRQQLSFQTDLHHGHLGFDFLGIQGLDADRASYEVEASYQLNRLWRLGYAYQEDRYFGSNYSDFDLVLGFRVGYKEFGLVWSQKLHRIGFQLLGTTLN